MQRDREREARLIWAFLRSTTGELLYEYGRWGREYRILAQSSLLPGCALQIQRRHDSQPEGQRWVNALVKARRLAGSPLQRRRLKRDWASRCPGDAALRGRQGWFEQPCSVLMDDDEERDDACIVSRKGGNMAQSTPFDEQTALVTFFVWLPSLLSLCNLLPGAQLEQHGFPRRAWQPSQRLGGGR